VLALPFLGRLAHGLGAQRLIWIGGLGIVPAALPWVLSDHFGVLLAAQLVAGVFWAGYELATFLLVFEHIPDDERTSVLTLFNFANAATIAAGSLVGGALLATLGANREAYVAIFALSTGLRALTPLLLARLGVPARVPVPLPAEAVIARTIAVRPSLGSIDRPILPTVPHAEPEREPRPA
jgi:MFS family permease